MNENWSSLENSKACKHFGFWWSSSEPHLPVPEDNYINPDIAQALLKQLREVQTSNYCGNVAYRDFSRCRICDALNGSSTIVCKMGHCIYAWPIGLSHYLEVHNIKPPQLMLEMLSAYDRINRE